MDTGFIHLYTGDGKGKTTAAMGLALRAAGHGRQVYIGQFMKGQFYGELASLSHVPGVTIEQFGDVGCFRKEEVTDLHREHAHNGLERIQEIFRENRHQLVILDEICVTIWFGLVELQEVLDLMEKRPPAVELVLTGRRAPDELIEAADLVTEMREVKHYYTQGILARDGIER